MPISELFIYDRDKGLFKEILKQSKVIQGRYHVAPHYGHELNTNNLDQYIKDPASGLSDIKQKYPCCVCIAPRSRIVAYESGSKVEEFVFHLYFLTTTFYTGGNQVKSPNKQTGTSEHHIWYDWKDMKEVAFEFLELLKKVSKKIELRTSIDVDAENANIWRLSKFNNDQVSGVGISFTVKLMLGECEFNDYDVDALDSIVIPDFDIHPAHKH